MLIRMLERFGDHHGKRLGAPQSLARRVPIYGRQLIEQFDLLMPNASKIQGQGITPALLNFSPGLIIVGPVFIGLLGTIQPIEH